jgi:acetyl esterase
MERGYREYLSSDTERRDPRVSPYFATDLSGLPPAFVLSAEYDSLRDEAESYARSLATAGVPVTAIRLGGAIHGVFQLGGVLEVGRRAMREAAAFLRSIT